MQRLYRRYERDSEDTLEYGWVFGITFFLILFLSQSLYIWIFDEIRSVLAWLFLLIFSFFISYVLLFGNGAAMLHALKKVVDDFIQKKYLHKSQTELTHIPEIERYALKQSEALEKNEMQQEILHEKLEKQAHDGGALISSDALRFVSDFGDGAERVLETVLERAKKELPRFDGWVVLSKDQVESLLKNEEISTEDEEEREVYLGDDDRKNHVMVPPNLPTGSLQQKHATAAAGFFQHLCEVDEHELFMFIRKMRQGSEEDVRTFMRDMILMLDRIHEHRVDGAGYVEKDVLEQTRCFSNKEIEELIAILIGSVDHRYTVPEIGVKLSLIRALEYIKKARKN